MPKIGKNPKPPADKNLNLSCSMCGQTKKSSEFYQSWNPLYQTQRLPYCKQCLKDMCHDTNGNIDVELVKKMLQAIDRPFLYDIWLKSVESNMEIIGCYFKNIGMTQFRYSTWKDSIMEPQLENNSNVEVIYSKEKHNEDFNLTEEIIDKWGEGYNLEQYRLFEKKYNKLKRNYGQKTELHTEAFLNYIRFRVLEEIATAKGDVGESGKWAALANVAALNAKINVSQLSKSDISGGVDVLAQLFEAIESEAGIIPLLPKVLEQPYDDADMIIWVMINYYRRLEGKPRISYREIWDFYDEMLIENFSQKGYTEEEIQQEKDKRNAVFRDMSLIYREPVYEDGDE